ncbi:MAG TPA: cytochrome c [Thermoleophilia bacterium]|nr:cytochrome c [Thermoleophilia bacterium]
MRGRAWIWALVAFAVAAAALLGVFVVSSLEDGADEGDPLARGEYLFETGRAVGGTPVPRSGGMMMAQGCAGCHGEDGRGRTTPRFAAPDITYDNLTDPEGMLEPDGERGHTFTDEELQRAIEEGIGPDGEELDWPMPRWRLTDSQFEDLLAYLKTLP